MTIRKTVTLVEEINSEYGAPASPRCDASRLPRCSRTRSLARRLAPTLNL